MDLEARKIEFIKEFLKLQSEEAISRLENILNKEKNTSDKQVLEPMSQEMLNKRIEQSEADFQNKRYKSSSELLTKYE